MIQVNLDVIMAKRKISLNELARRMDLSLANLSILKNNKCKAIRFSTLSNLCDILECEVGDILVNVKGEDSDGTEPDTGELR
ncbi:MAG: helix-turn-helix domain-containing protein [Eubacteriales bacterium]|nr:helix-turn-helix domain-containing protein [Eubacteriales bacterium]